MKNNWSQNDNNKEIWWLDMGDEDIGVIIFSFDKKTTFNLFADYPHKLTKEQKEIFDKEEPFWAEFFSDRS